MYIQSVPYFFSNAGSINLQQWFSTWETQNVLPIQRHVWAWHAWCLSTNLWWRRMKGCLWSWMAAQLYSTIYMFCAYVLPGAMERSLAFYAPAARTLSIRCEESLLGDCIAQGNTMGQASQGTHGSLPGQVQVHLLPGKRSLAATLWMVGHTFLTARCISSE